MVDILCRVQTYRACVYSADREGSLADILCSVQTYRACVYSADREGSLQMPRPLSWLHTASSCKILQHTATHGDTLQHTATYCKTLGAYISQLTRQDTYSTDCNTLQDSRSLYLTTHKTRHIFNTKALHAYALTHAASTRAHTRTPTQTRTYTCTRPHTCANTRTNTGTHARPTTHNNSTITCTYACTRAHAQHVTRAHAHTFTDRQKDTQRTQNKLLDTNCHNKELTPMCFVCPFVYVNKSRHAW